MANFDVIIIGAGAAGLMCAIVAGKRGRKVLLVDHAKKIGEKISEIKDILDQNALGVMLSCVSPENYEQNFEEMRSLGVPFGFKFNAFQTTKPKGGYTNNYGKSNGNPNEFLGQRTDLNPVKIAEFAKRFKNGGATILGGCCETRPSHIKAISSI